MANLRMNSPASRLINNNLHWNPSIRFNLCRTEQYVSSKRIQYLSILWLEIATLWVYLPSEWNLLQWVYPNGLA